MRGNYMDFMSDYTCAKVDPGMLLFAKIF